jgi:hypothetical protein
VRVSKHSDKPFYRCPVEIKPDARGNLEFHVTRRDGQIEVLPGPPGMTQITSNVEAIQREGSDDVEIMVAGQ